MTKGMNYLHMQSLKKMTRPFCNYEVKKPLADLTQGFSRTETEGGVFLTKAFLFVIHHDKSSGQPIYFCPSNFDFAIKVKEDVIHYKTFHESINALQKLKK